MECTNNSNNVKIVHEQGNLVFVIGASLSGPHTVGLHCACVGVCLLAAIYHKF